MHAAETVIHINLLPIGQQAVSRTFALNRTTAIIVIALAAVFSMVTIVSFVQGLRVRALRTEIDALHIEARETRHLTQRINVLTAEREAVRARLAVIEQLDRDRYARVRLADELSRRLPDHVWLTSFSENTGNVVITGVTFSNLSVADLMSRLERSTLYEAVDLIVTRRGTIDDHEVINFTITARRQTFAAPSEETAG